MFRVKIINTRGALCFSIALILLVSPSGGRAAEQSKDSFNLEARLTQCAEFDSNLQRLECYDGLAERAIQASPRAAAPLMGETAAMLRPVEVKDEPALPLGPFEIESRREVPRAKGRKLRPRLVAECGAEPKASIVLGVILPAGTVPVNTRIDTGEVVKETWLVGADKGRVLVPNPTQFLKSLKRGKILEVKVSPRKGAPIPFSFDVADFGTGCR
jgi:hypothetical protein